MKIRDQLLSLMSLSVFILAACGGTPTASMEKSENTMMDNPTEEAMMSHDTPMPDAMEQPTEAAMMEMSAWFGASFEDVRTGESFAINDFQGKVILVETMAVWCPTCFRQQQEIKSLHELLGMREDFVSISLDIDPNEDETILAAYTQQNNQFDWLYAIAGPDISREIGNAYGNQFLNPPSAPVLVIDRHGVVHPLPFGLKSAEELMKQVQPYLDETM